MLDYLRDEWVKLPALSASQIGAHIGVSRNAVIGKAHRLGLPTRRDPKQKKRQLTPGVRKPQVARRKPPPPRAPLVEPHAQLLRPPPPPEGVSLLDLDEARDCRWLLDNGNYCGADRDGPSHYCAKHHAATNQPSPPRTSIRGSVPIWRTRGR